MMIIIIIIIIIIISTASSFFDTLRVENKLKKKRGRLKALYSLKIDILFSKKGLARRGSTIGFHLLWHKVELAMSTRLCLLK